MKRPHVPLWSHRNEAWILDGRVYDNVRDADYQLTKNLFDYCDYLEAKIASQSGVEADAESRCGQCDKITSYGIGICDDCAR